MDCITISRSKWNITFEAMSGEGVTTDVDLAEK
jgi:hypothetical protein